MDVLVRTDNSFKDKEVLAQNVETSVRHTLSPFAERITRVEVHLTDENSHKHGADDKRCVMEARIAGVQPVVVTHNAPDADKAVSGASDKLRRAVDTVVGKLTAH